MTGGVKISALPAAAVPLTGAELFAVVQSSETRFTTVDDITNLVPGLVRDHYNVKDYGAVGNGTTNDTSALQTAIDAAALVGNEVFFPAGTYRSGSLLLRSNTTLRGIPGLSIIQADAALATNAFLLRNDTSGTYTNANINLRDMVIDGNNLGAGGTQTRLTALISLSRVTGSRWSNVQLRNVQYIGLALAACRDVRIDGGEFGTCGYSGTTTNGGSAIWCSYSGADNSRNVTFTGVTFRNNRWHGTHFACEEGRISGCYFKDNQEAHVFAPKDGSGRRTFIGNILDGVTQHDISASAIEIGGNKVQVIGNHINNSHAGVALTDVTDAVVSGNQILAATQDGVWIICNSTAPDQPNNIVVVGNRISDAGAACPSAIRITNAGDPVTGVVIANNVLTGTWTSGAAFQGLTKIGADCRIHDNAGWNPAGIANITVGASPFTYTAGPSPETIYIRGGTVSAIAIGAGPATIFTETAHTVALGPLERVIVTYSVLPNMIRYIH